MSTYARVKIPIKTVSESNVSEHWSKKYKRTSSQKKMVRYELMHKNIGTTVTLPCEIKITRTGKRLLDDDNLVSSLKSIRDAISDVIIPGLRPGAADADSRLRWTYAQQTGPEYYVEVEIHCHPYPAYPDAESEQPLLARSH